MKNTGFGDRTRLVDLRDVIGCEVDHHILAHRASPKHRHLDDHMARHMLLEGVLILFLMVYSVLDRE